MCNYINRLLSYKNKSNLFLNSFIVIVCDKNNKNNISYLNKAIKHKKIENINIKHINLNNIINNVKVITSEVYGLGKSCQIKKMIEQSKKNYYYLKLGGLLIKTDIFEKFKSLLNKIKENEGKSYNNIALHLDLKESEEISLLNEFLFSLLITKFYST